MLRHRDRRLDAALRRALLAEVLERHRVVLHLRDAHDAFAFPAHVAQHQATTPRTSVSDQSTILEQQRAVRARRQRPVMRDDDHPDLQVARQLREHLVQPLAVP